jgi:hypothetical protein
VIAGFGVAFPPVRPAAYNVLLVVAFFFFMSSGQLRQLTFLRANRRFYQNLRHTVNQRAVRGQFVGQPRLRGRLV